MVGDSYKDRMKATVPELVIFSNCLGAPDQIITIIGSNSAGRVYREALDPTIYVFEVQGAGACMLAVAVV